MDRCRIPILLHNLLVVAISQIRKSKLSITTRFINPVTFIVSAPGHYPMYVFADINKDVI